jgi:hypothetical protein
MRVIDERNHTHASEIQPTKISRRTNVEQSRLDQTVVPAAPVHRKHDGTSETQYYMSTETGFRAYPEDGWMKLQYVE